MSHGRTADSSTYPMEVAPGLRIGCVDAGNAPVVARARWQAGTSDAVRFVPQRTLCRTERLVRISLTLPAICVPMFLCSGTALDTEAFVQLDDHLAELEKSPDTIGCNPAVGSVAAAGDRCGTAMTPLTYRYFCITRVALVPPKPKLLDMIRSTAWSRRSRRIGRSPAFSSSSSMLAEAARKLSRIISMQ